MSAVDMHAGWSLLRHVRIVANEADDAALIAELVAHPGPRVVSFLNQNGFNLACRDPELRAGLTASDVLLRDGVGMEACFRWLGLDPGRNMNGTDFIPRLLAACRDRRLLLIGTEEPWLGRAAEALRRSSCNPVAARDGYRPPESYVADVVALRPEVVILALGTPRQERLAIRLRGLQDGPRLIISGGAILDFLGGRFPRAPETMRSLRLEWLFRLALEPCRLAPRYLAGGPIFIARSLQLRSGRPAPARPRGTRARGAAN